MKLPVCLKLLTLSSLFIQTALTAVSVSTDPVGYKNVTIHGDNKLTFLGIEFIGSAEYVGVVTSAGTNSISVDNASFDNLLDLTESYFLEITSGENEGVNTLLTDWSGNSLITGDDLSGLINVNSDSIKICRLPTISEIFDGVLNGGAGATADLIFMPNPYGEGLITVFYSTGGFSGVGWRQIGAGSADKSNLPIYFSDGLYILKRSPGDVNITTYGTVKLNKTVQIISQGFTPFSTVFPVGTTLANSGLFDPLDPSESISAGTAATADLIFMDSDNDGSIETYYYSTGGFSGVGWRQVGAGSINKSDTPLSSGFGILKRNGEVAITRFAAY